MDRRIADLRVDYALHALDPTDVPADPIVAFRQWFDEALAAEVTEPNGMTVATVDHRGRPAARIVLL
jgi:pyridoxamine 5'-phosphate oxidase